MAKADIFVKLIPDLSLFKKELNKAVKGAAGGAANNSSKEDASKQKKAKGDSVTLNKMLKTLGVIAIVSTLVGGLLKTFEPVIKLLGVIITLLFIPLIPIMKKVLISLGEFAKKAVKNVSAVLGGDINLTEFFENVFGDAGTLINEITPIITQFMDKMFNALLDVVINNADKIVAFIFKFLLKIGEAIAIAAIDLGKALGQFLINLFNKDSPIGRRISEVADEIKLDIKEMFSNLIESIKEIWNKFIDSIKNTLSGITDKIRSVWDNFVSSIKSAISRIVDKIQNFRLFGGGRSRETNVGDAIIRPNGQIIRTDPADTLIATKNPEALGGGVSMTFAPNITISGGINSELDIRRIAEQIAKLGFEELTRRTGGLRL